MSSITNTKSVPRDGWISVKPGQTIEIETSLLNDKRIQLNQYMNHIRGIVLSSSFNLENITEVIILNYYIGSLTSEAIEADKNRYAHMQGNLVRPLNFDKKIKVVKNIAKIMLPPEECEELCTKMGQLQTLRNTMAHYPCWIEPVLEKDSIKVIDLKIYLAKGEELWEVNEAQFEKWAALIDSTVNLAENLARKLAKT